MKNVIGISLTISGFLFSLFVLNVLMYAFLPGYRMFLNDMIVGKKSEIPVIEADNDVFSRPESGVVIPAVSSEFVDELSTGVVISDTGDIGVSEVSDIVDETVALSAGIADAELADDAEASDCDGSTIMREVTVSEENSENAESKVHDKPQIIERTYHEDCGTGKGYWVIKYSDGSYGIE